MRKKWKCMAEVNMCANHIETVVVETNTKKKAMKLAEDILMKNNFYAKILSIEEVT